MDNAGFEKITHTKPRKVKEERRRNRAREGGKPLRDDKGWSRHDKRASWQ